MEARYSPVQEHILHVDEQLFVDVLIDILLHLHMQAV
jgi:hypothetical protein